MGPEQPRPDSDLPVQLTIEDSVIAQNHRPRPKEPHTGGGGLVAQFRVTPTRTLIAGNSPRQYSNAEYRLSVPGFRVKCAMMLLE
jgi:hypothetical protein